MDFMKLILVFIGVMKQKSENLFISAILII